jgi:hypothetical protein
VLCEGFQFIVVLCRAFSAGLTFLRLPRAARLAETGPSLALGYFVLLSLIPLLPVAAQDAGTEAKELAGRLPRLDDSAQVSLITYTPGEELYQAFGHSAIRIKDDLLNMDRLYNFGVFDFETPDFYLKFAHGDLFSKSP